MCEHGRSSTGLQMRCSIISQVQLQLQADTLSRSLTPQGSWITPDLVRVLAHVPQLFRQGPQAPEDAPVRPVPARVFHQACIRCSLVSHNAFLLGQQQQWTCWTSLNVSFFRTNWNTLAFTCAVCLVLPPLYIYLMYGNSPHVDLF